MEVNSTSGQEHSDPRSIWQDHIFHGLIAAIDGATAAVPDLSVLALKVVLSDIITGEGPTVAGRMHFSRTLDRADAALCALILEQAGGPAGVPVTREEVEVLLEIDAAGAERSDNGRFGDLLVKALAHYVLASAGHKVPPRQQALAPATDLSGFAGPAHIDVEVLAWLAANVHRRRRRSATLLALAAFLTGIGAKPPFAIPPSAATTLVDLVA